MPTHIALPNLFLTISESLNSLVSVGDDLHCLLSTSALCSSFSTVMPSFRLFGHLEELSPNNQALRKNQGCVTPI